MTYNADRPLTDRAQDELGLAEVADTIADRILALRPASGLVVGLQSPWGMGKTTFLNFLIGKLEAAPLTIVVKFSPWLVDDRDALLRELFTEISRSLEGAEKRQSHRWDLAESHQRRATARRIRQFARLAERLKAVPQAPHLSWFKDLFNLPVAREAGAVTGFLISTAAALKPNDETLRELRNDIAMRLALLKYKIVVVVDDIDRLEAAEAREVFRLVRAVADFPNTTYLVAFDREPLGFDEGREADIARAYLDKIVQVPLSLPRPEPVDLRRILSRAVIGDMGEGGALGRPLRTVNSLYRRDSEAQRFGGVVDALVRTYLNSPRRIGIAHNVLMTTWPGVSEEADIADFLIHLCFTNFDRAMATWVDDYLAVQASRRLSRLSPKATAELKGRLDEILAGAVRHREDRLMLLRSLLPTMRGY